MRLILLFLLSCLTTVAAAETVIFPEESGPASPWLTKGWSAYLAGELASAEEDFQRAKESDPHSHQAYFGLEMLACGRGEYPQGFLHAVKALEEGVNSPWLELYLADAEGLAKYSSSPEILTEILASLLKKEGLTYGQHLLLQLYLARVTQNPSDFSAVPFLRHWQVLGPFNNRERSGFLQEFGPEETFPAIDLQKSHPGRNRPVRWTPLLTANPSGYYNLARILHPGEESVGYALTAVQLPSDMTITLVIGTAGAGSLRVGQREVARWEAYFNYHPLQRSFELNLPKGETRILLKVAGEREGEMGFSCLLLPGRLTDLRKTEEIVLRPTINASTEPVNSAPPVSHTTMEKPLTGTDAGLNWGLLGFLRTSLVSSSQPAALQMALGYLYLNRGLDDRLHLATRPLFEAAAGNAPLWPPAQEFASLVQTDSNHSRRYLERVRTQHPAEVTSQELLIHLLHRGGFLVEAESLAKTLLTRSPSADALETLGEIARGRNWYPEASQFFERAIKGLPGEGNLYRHLASMAEGRATRIEWLRKGFERTKDPTLEEELILLLLTENSTSLSLADSLLTSALDRHPFSLALQQLAIDRSLTRDGTKEAEKRVASALLALPQEPLLYQRQGEIFLRNNNPASAILAWKEALAIRPDSPQLRDYLQAIQPQKTVFYQAYQREISSILTTRVKPETYPLYNRAVLLDQGVVFVHSNGNRDMMIHLVQQALTPAGAKQISSYRIPFDPERERIEVLAARVIQPDGSTLSAKNITERSVGGGGGESTVYNQGHVKEFSFSQVAEGSVVELQYTVEATGESLYGNFFEDAFFFGGNDPTLDFEYVLDSSLALPVEAVTFDAEKVGAQLSETKTEDRRQRVWSAKNIPGFEMEPGMPPYEEMAPVIRSSTFADWKTVGNWYWQLSRESMTLPPALEAKTKELVANAKSDEEKLSAIYYFIIDAVRYVGIEFGRNGYVPHSCERTVTTRYGDCKDTAVLFVAMLGAAGIDARVALVRTWNQGVDPTDLPGTRRFNHAIAYVPSINGRSYWLDGTTDYNHFDELPVMDQGTLALITGPDGGRLLPIPEDPATANRETVRYTIRVEADGSALIDAKIDYTGAFASGYRQTFETPERLQKGLEFFVKRQFPGASLCDFKTSGSDLRKREVFFHFSLKIPSFARSVGGQWKLLPWIMPGRYSLLAGQNERKNDLILGLLRQRVLDVTILLPKGAAVTSLPQGISVDAPFGMLKRESSAEGETVKVILDTRILARRIKRESYPAFRDFTHQADSAEQEWLIYTLPDGTAAQAAAKPRPEGAQPAVPEEGSSSGRDR